MSAGSAGRSPRVTLFDYGAGNLHSLAKALERAGAAVHVETDAARAVADTDALVLPGVGAFAAAAERLAPGREAMRDAVAAGLPTLGICLGMQLLFEASDEGEGAGLALIPGRATRLDARHVPQIGWNTVTPTDPADPDPLLAASALEVAYYANSFVCRPSADTTTVIAWSEHEGDRYPAAVRLGRTVGVQFHPEKSSAPGVAMVAAWVRGPWGTLACPHAPHPRGDRNAVARSVPSGLARSLERARRCPPPSLERAPHYEPAPWAGSPLVAGTGPRSSLAGASRRRHLLIASFSAPRRAHGALVAVPH
jgi:glutamine amidotransferase